MSTPNFHNKNASKIFAQQIEDEIDYDALIENIRCDKRLLKYEEEEKYENGLRSYGGSIFMKRIIYKNNYILKIQLIVRSGYYSGVNLDWEIEVVNNSYENYWEDSIAGDVCDERLPNYISKILEKEVKKIENVYEDYTTPLHQKAVFSNGEAIYELAK